MRLEELTNDSCERECPVRKTAEIIDGKWTSLIIRDLLGGKKRFSELQRSLEGISPKMLSARMRFLEERGIVRKKIYPVVPPHTEYSLTQKGQGLVAVIEAMAAFGASL